MSVTVTRSCTSNEPLKSTTRFSSHLLRGSFLVSRKTARCRPHSGSPHSSQAAHPSKDTRRSPGWPSAEAPLETRLAAVTETATSTHLDALDDEDRATAKLKTQKAAQAADEALLCGKCPDAARLHHQSAEKTRKHGVDRIRRVPTVRLLLGLTAGTRRNLQHRRSDAGTQRMRSRCGVPIETRRRSQQHYGTQRAHSNAIQAC